MTSIKKKIAQLQQSIEATDYSKAQNICQDILKKDPNNFTALYNFSVILLQRKQNSAALELATKALNISGNSLEQFNILGIFFMRLEAYKQALYAFKEAMKISTDNFTTNYNIAVILSKFGQYEDSLYYYIRAADSQPSSKIFSSIGIVLFLLKRMPEAISYFTKSIEMDNKNYDAYYGLGRVYHMSNNYKDAELMYKKALSGKKVPSYYFDYSNVKSFSTNDKDIISDMLAILESPKATDQDKIHLNFALGKIFDDCKNYDKAFEHYKTGNQIIGKHATNSDSDKLHKTLLKNKNCFTSSFYKKISGYENTSDQPVFVTGMPRSGTSLVEEILTSHSEVAGIGEAPYLTNIERHIEESASKNEMDFSQYIDTFKEDRVKDLAQNYLDITHKHIKTENEHQGNIKHIVNKVPGNFLRTGLIFLLFKNAKVINCKRHPLDVCLSMYFQHFANISQASKLENIAMYYKDYVQHCLYWEKIFPGKIYDIYYEKLVSQQENESRKLLDFCELSWEEGCMEFYKNKRMVDTSSYWQVRRPIYKTSKFRWKNYERHLESLKSSLKDEIRNYEEQLAKL